MNWNTLSRRELLAAAAGGLAASLWTSPLAAQWPAPQENTVEDRLWLFGSPTGSTAPHTKRRTVMSPVEGAFYLGIPNIYMNQANAGPETGHHEPLHLQRRRPVERHASLPRAQQDERPNPHPRRVRRLRAPRLTGGLSYVPRLHHQGLA